MSINSGSINAEITSTLDLRGSMNVPEWIKGDPGPAGKDGKDGKDGDSGVYVGTTEPTDPDKLVWINPEGKPDEGGDSATVAVDNKTIIQNEDGTISTFVGGWLEEIPSRPIFESSTTYIINEGEDNFVGEITEEEAESLKDNVLEDMPATVRMTINGKEFVYEDITLDVSSRRIEFIPVDYDDNSIIDTVLIDMRGCEIEFILTDAPEEQLRISDIIIEQGGNIYHKINSNYVSVDEEYIIVGGDGAITINENAFFAIATDAANEAGFIDAGRVETMIDEKLAAIPIAEEVSV